MEEVKHPGLTQPGSGSYLFPSREGIYFILLYIFLECLVNNLLVSWQEQHIKQKYLLCRLVTIACSRGLPFSEDILSK